MKGSVFEGRVEQTARCGYGHCLKFFSAGCCRDLIGREPDAQYTASSRCIPHLMLSLMLASARSISLEQDTAVFSPKFAMACVHYAAISSLIEPLMC